MPYINLMLIGQFHPAPTLQRRLSADPFTDDVPVLAPPNSGPVTSILENDMLLGIRCDAIMLAKLGRNCLFDFV
jgi:hypothetical protein